jgi:hypothetical protein
VDHVEISHYMGATLSRHGFTLDQVNDVVDYGGRSAGAVFYRSVDCKLQICWSAREGGLDFMLAGLDAPNEFGLINGSKKWHYMLMLDKSEDGLSTPRIGSDAATWWEWRNALFDRHVDAARAALK